jgi:hypothetical protein
MTTEEPSVAFSVVRGNPTEEELAALVTVLALCSRSNVTAAERPSSGWSAYWRSVRAPVTPGPNAWRMSGRPQ